MGEWALWLTLTALTTLIAGLVAAGLYLHSGQDAWPPTDIARPGVGRAGIALVGAVLTAALTHLAVRRMRHDDRSGATARLGLGMVVGSAAVAALARDLAGSGFRWDAHAYTSLYWVATGTSALLIAVGVLMLAATIVQVLVGIVDDRRMLELHLTARYLWWAVAAVAVCLAVAHLLPDPAPVEAAAALTGRTPT